MNVTMKVISNLRTKTAFTISVRSFSKLLHSNVTAELSRNCCSTMAEEKSPPIGAIKVNPLRISEAFEKIKETVDTEAGKSHSSNTPSGSECLTEAHMSDPTHAGETDAAAAEHIEVKAKKNVASLLSKLDKEVKLTVLPPSLLHKVTKMIKQEKVSLPTLDTEQQDSANLEKVAANKGDKFIEMNVDVDSDNKVSEVETASGDMEQKTFDPFRGLEVDDPVDTKVKRKKIDETDILPDISALFTGELDKRRKRELKKAKIKSWKKKEKKQKKEKQSESGIDVTDKPDQPAKPAVNYFIAIQISNPEIKAALETVQKDVVSKNKDLAHAMNKMTTLHLTMFVLSLNNEDDMQKSKLALNEAQKRLQPLHGIPLSLDIAGLGHFRNTVVFAKVKDETDISKLEHIAETIEDCFLEQEIVSPDKKGFKPHITIMKLSYLKGRHRKVMKKIDENLYKEHVATVFGTQQADTLQLCSMLMKKDEFGYYQVDHKVRFASNMEVTDSTVSCSCEKERNNGDNSVESDYVVKQENMDKVKVEDNDSGLSECLIVDEDLNKDENYKTLDNHNDIDTVTVTADDSGMSECLDKDVRKDVHQNTLDMNRVKVLNNDSEYLVDDSKIDNCPVHENILDIDSDFKSVDLVKADLNVDSGDCVDPVDLQITHEVGRTPAKDERGNSEMDVSDKDNSNMDRQEIK